MTSVAPPTEFFPGINFNASFYNLGQSAVTLDYLNSNFLRSTGYAISRAQYTLFNGSVNIQQNLDVSQNINAGGYALNGVPVTFSQWTTSVNDIYYNTGNVGIGKTNPSATYKLDVSGNINADKFFRAGTELTQYTDTNVRTVLSTSAGTNMTWNTGTNKFDVAAPYTDTNTRTVLSTSAGTNMTWNTGTNKFDVAVTSYTLPIATNGVLGGVKPDVDTIIVNPSTGLISLSGSDISLNGTADRAYGWLNSTSLLGRCALAASYSTNSLINDVVLRSANNLILQSGVGTSALTINTTNQALFRNAVGIGTTSITAGLSLHVVGTSFFSQPVRLSSTVSTSYWWDGNGNTFLGRVATAGIYSNLSAVGDLVLSSDKKILMKSGPTANGCALCVDLSNNIGIGTTVPTSGYKLDVIGDIITSGNINLANTSTSLFWGGTNSNLGRAGLAGQYSTSSAINDIVLRSGNKLILQSGVGAAGVVIDTANNVGIGTINPSVRLDIIGNVKIQSSRVAIQSSGFAINNNYMYPDTLTIGNQDINYGGGQNWNTNTASLMFECRDHTEIAVHDSGNYVHSFMWYYQNAFTIGRNMGWGAPNVNIAGNLIVAGNLNVNTSKLVIRGTEPTLYLRDTNNRSGMIHMNSSIMYFLNASGNDSETWAQQNGQDWCLQLNMDNNTATFGGNLNVNGNIAHRTENWHTSSDGRNRFYFSASNATYYSGGMSGGANARMHEWRRTYDDAYLGWFENTGLFRSWGYSSLSDTRIKKNIRDIDDVQALEKILLIQPKKYNYIEKERNKHDVIGFIAQQIGEVIPEAITKTEGIVPNIYKNCLVNNKREVYCSIPLDVVIDTEVIITDTEDGTGGRYKIKEIYDDYFVIDKDIDRDEVFVKGYSINDLHNLDKNYIYTLNVCATQELYKLIMEQREEINNLKNRLSTLENVNN
jgi:hypothetical protein